MEARLRMLSMNNPSRQLTMLAWKRINQSLTILIGSIMAKHQNPCKNQHLLRRHNKRRNQSKKRKWWNSLMKCNWRIWTFFWTLITKYPSKTQPEKSIMDLFKDSSNGTAISKISFPTLNFTTFSKQSKRTKNNLKMRKKYRLL